ncbi:hypothetical protein [Candidatus Jidaibacter acanthamoebae]|uniref:hypothetical protein n=1 Tax=Candidatus Jidaibacter acanthamoebae TaxID=86105 RepID=UPI00058020A7|nr:hypothetical protein [Candidatus Jidaibacter acanthamoeba]
MNNRFESAQKEVKAVEERLDFKIDNLRREFEAFKYELKAEKINAQLTNLKRLIFFFYIITISLIIGIFKLL